MTMTTTFVMMKMIMTMRMTTMRILLLSPMLLMGVAAGCGDPLKVEEGGRLSHQLEKPPSLQLRRQRQRLYTYY